VPSIRNSIEILLSHLPNVIIQPHEVNQLAILLECPLFRKRRNHALRQKLCVVLSGLLPPTKEAFCEVLIMYDADLFEKRMGMLKDHLMLSLRHNQR
jgi:mRNA-degrading endonuclease toxin of MazEF toxin-antitoxin module